MLLTSSEMRVLNFSALIQIGYNMPGVSRIRPTTYTPNAYTRNTRPPKQRYSCHISVIPKKKIKNCLLVSIERTKLGNKYNGQSRMEY